MIALKAAVAGTTTDHLQIFNLGAPGGPARAAPVRSRTPTRAELKAKMKSHVMSESVVYWKWLSPSLMGLVTATSVYHWTIEGETPPVKVFDRAPGLAGSQIINYRASPDQKWLVLVGIAPGAPEV